MSDPPQGAVPHDHRPDDHADDWSSVAPAEAVAVVQRSRGAIGMGTIGVLLLAVALVSWWAQDLVGTLANEGEADVGGEVAFVAEAGTYRVVTSGPTKPEIERTVCDVALADESELHIIGGTGKVNPVTTFGTARVVQFDAPAGPTTVSCTDRLSPRATGGRFQVIASNGPVRYTTGALAAVGVLLLAGGILWGVLGHRRSQRDPDEAPAVGT